MLVLRLYAAYGDGILVPVLAALGPLRCVYSDVDLAVTPAVDGRLAPHHDGTQVAGHLLQPSARRAWRTSRSRTRP